MLCGQPSTSGRPFQCQLIAPSSRGRLQTWADQRQLDGAPKNHQHHCFPRIDFRAAATSDAGQQAPAELQLLVSMDTEHSKITILRFPVGHPVGQPLAGSTALFLNKKGSSSVGQVNSVYREDGVLIGNNTYWEHLSLIAAAAPEGPIACLGLGCGTIPRIIHAFWPSRVTHGWEVDPVVLDAGRDHMGLKALEGLGALVCHAGDALSAAIDGGFAGIIVDLFSGTDVLECLKEREQWQQICSRLKPGGCIIANLGATTLTAQVMREALPDCVLHVKQNGENLLVISGSNPSTLKGSLPEELRHIADGWISMEDLLRGHADASQETGLKKQVHPQ